MQEQKLFKIEEFGCWLAFWGLLISMIVQLFMGDDSLRYIGGEWCVFMILAIYMIVSCFKSGIWAKYIKASYTTNFFFSLASGVIVGVLSFLIKYQTYKKMAGSIASGVIIGAQLFFVSFVSLCILTYFFKKKEQKINDAPEDEI